MAKKVFLIAGEVSGDALGARLMKALKAQTGGAVEFRGVGGPKMQAEGLESLLPMEDLCVIGLWEVIWQLPRLIRLIRGMVEEIEKFDPDALVTIDLPDFNFAVASRVRKRGTSKAKLIHYVAPSVWAWRPKRADKISRFLDGLICLLPFEPEYFPKIKAVFAGHPLIEGARQGDRAAFRESFGLTPEIRVAGAFYGSRPSELKRNKQVINEALVMAHEHFPDLHVVTPTVPHMEFDVLKATGEITAQTFVINDPDAKWDAFAGCDAAVAVSGTICLELAVAGVPHVLVYKVHPVTWLLMRLLIKVKYAHLANILLGREVIPEYLQGRAKPLAVGKGLLALMLSEDERRKQAGISQEIRQLLGADHEKAPSERAAEFVLSQISE